MCSENRDLKCTGSRAKAARNARGFTDPYGRVLKRIVVSMWGRRYTYATSPA
jgi:hypothetical protein